ncbi:excalibur calcium-binding domain-containing protein [Streptomyces sp. NPDC048270]|uniref:excalibur calcium-binding domain-containing protein n=1 Tax=Streptomyces sp. NPDC048270 TaxID=3154615 RepID=UPI0033FBEA1F
MYSPPTQYAPRPQQPVQRWWQRTAVIVTALVLLPPLGMALAWMTRWTQGKKIVATVLSGLWFLIVLFSGGDDKGAEDDKVGAANAATASPGSAAIEPGKAAAPSAAPVLPNVVSMPFDQAEKALKGAGVAKVEALSVYTDVPLASYHPNWAVCFQSPDAGAGPADATLHLIAPGKTCPAVAGTRLHAEATKAPTKAPTPTQGDADGTSGTGGGGGVSYKNCDAAKAAGAAPIRKGQPGYRSALDKDGDGIACDK